MARKDKDKMNFYKGVGALLALILGIVLFAVPGSGARAVEVLVKRPSGIINIITLGLSVFTFYLVAKDKLNIQGKNGDTANWVYPAAFGFFALTFVLLIYQYALYKNPGLWNPNIEAIIRSYSSK